MDWSHDGSRMAFVLDSQSNTMGGLWLYEAQNKTTRPLVVPQRREGYLTAEFSPDGQSILLQSVMTPLPVAAHIRRCGNNGISSFRSTAASKKHRHRFLSRMLDGCRMDHWFTCSTSCKRPMVEYSSPQQRVRWPKK